MTERLPTSLPEVTPRQREVARLVADGLTNEEIAARLQISLAGAKYHVSELLGRLGAERREEIADWYRRGGADRPRPWLHWQRALIALAAGVLGATAIVAMAVGVPTGGGDSPWAEGSQNAEVVTRAHVEGLLTGLVDGGILHTRTENYYRDGRPWGVGEHSFTLPERHVNHSWGMYGSDGTLQQTIGVTTGEDGRIYVRSASNHAVGSEATELPTTGYLHADFWDGPVPRVGPLDVLKGLDEKAAGLREAAEGGLHASRLDAGRITIVLRGSSYPCGRRLYPVDLFPMRAGERVEHDAEASTYFSLRSECWADLDDGSEALLASTSITYEALDVSEWDAIVDRVWPDGIPMPASR